MDHFVTAGLMTTNELKEFDSISSQHFKYWTPIQWAFLLLRRARDKNMIESDIIYVDMLEKIRVFRLQVLTLTLYDWVPIPLVYTQVVNMAVRAYFAIALFGRQYLSLADRDIDKPKGIDLYIPIMTLMQFLFYMGWTKVAEMMLNPLGEDDDDFETNWIIDRNLQVGFSIVDDGYGRVPDLEHDMFWEEAIPEPLYTAESASRPHNPMIGSCNDIAEQQDALLAQPRRRRLMSTATMFDNSFIKRDPENDDANVVPVQNHNPTRRMSIAVPHPFADSGHHTGILDTVRRKFSRSTVRHDSVLPSYDSSFDKSLPANGGFSPNKAPPLRTQSLNRNLPSNSPPTNRDAPAFSQSLNITRTQPTHFDSSTSSLHHQDMHENGNAGPGIPDRPREHSGNWQYNEMLPIIEEVQERLRRNQRDSITESILTESASNSSPKNSIHNAESSRKVSPAAEVKDEKGESSDKTAGEVSSEIQTPETALPSQKCCRNVTYYKQSKRVLMKLRVKISLLLKFGLMKKVGAMRLKSQVSTAKYR
ncbi:bestrophin, RFP-TM, chloride channel domain-containing protein [Ditylenchus destructor]|nr:bestrophin, RFP-TM, chloride channel domain-containing protein [Ditylenchus destructor]